jgi:hypothetical protein
MSPAVAELLSCPSPCACCWRSSLETNAQHRETLLDAMVYLLLLVQRIEELASILTTLHVLDKQALVFKVLRVLPTFLLKHWGRWGLEFHLLRSILGLIARYLWNFVSYQSLENLG